LGEEQNKAIHTGAGMGRGDSRGSLPVWKFRSGHVLQCQSHKCFQVFGFPRTVQFIRLK